MLVCVCVCVCVCMCVLVEHKSACHLQYGLNPESDLLVLYVYALYNVGQTVCVCVMIGVVGFTSTM